MAASPDPIEDGEGYATSMAWCKCRGEDGINDQVGGNSSRLCSLSIAGCYQKGSLGGSRVEVVKVEGRRFEVRVAPTGTPDEYRMLIIRATTVINPDPELEMARAQEVAERYMKQTCKGRA
jgi:hypothetical protein